MMRLPLLLLFAFVILLLSGSNFALAQDIPALLVETKRIVREAKSPERAIEQVQTVLHKGLHGKFWSDVEPPLQKAGLKASGEPWGGFTTFRYDVLPSACTTPGGIQLDFYWELSISEGRAEPSYEVPPNHDIYLEYVGLTAKVMQPVKDVLAANSFGKDSLIQAALRDWPVAAETKDYPLLEKVEMFYVPGSVNSFDGGVPNRLHVHLSFLPDKHDPHTRRQLQCYADVPKKGKKPFGKLAGWTRHDEWPAGGAKTLVADLAKLIQDKPANYQLLLYRATHLVQRATLHREWPTIAKEFAGQGLKLTKDDSWQYGNRYEYIVAKNAFQTAAGLKMDLILQFSTSRQTSREAATKETIFEALPVLRAAPQASYETVISQELFGKGTAAHQALLHEDVAKSAKRCPWIGSVDISYDALGLSHRIPVYNWGFAVEPYLIRGQGDDSEYENLNVYLNSQLDLPTRDGGTQLVKDFVPKNTLDEPFTWGGSSSGTRGDGPKKERGRSSCSKREHRAGRRVPSRTSNRWLLMAWEI